jgi:hypothetical protein
MTGKLGIAMRRTSAAVVAWLTALWCSAPVAAQTIDQLYALAKQEKTLTMWAADPTIDYDSAARAFEQQFPGVSVLLTRGFSNVLDAGIEEQVRAKKGDTDLVILQTVQDFLAWNRHGLLLPFKPDGFEKVDIRSKDKDGGWIAVNRNPIFYGYNTEQVRHKDVPRLAIDFLRAEFKGKLIRRYSFRLRHHRSKIWLGLHGPIHETAAQIRPGSSRRCAQPRFGRRSRERRRYREQYSRCSARRRKSRSGSADG